MRPAVQARPLGRLRVRHCSRRPVPAAQLSTTLRQFDPAPSTAGSSRRRLLLWLGGALMPLTGPSSRGLVAAAAGVTDMDKVLDDPKWPAQFPFRAEDFLRYDEAKDTEFYSTPRFVYHIDEYAVKALTEYYGEVFPSAGQKDVALLDLCSSWVSHYPEGYSAGKVTGLGMNEEELARNPVLTDYTVHDLNEDPTLPYPDNTFDVVTNTVSVDYLNKPLEVFKEIHRVLKPGGAAYMSFSNRCFFTKAIALWTATGDADHIWIVGSYFHYTGGFTPPQVKDITPKSGLFGKVDPMYVVFARKAEEATTA